MSINQQSSDYSFIAHPYVLVTFAAVDSSLIFPQKSENISPEQLINVTYLQNVQWLMVKLSKTFEWLYFTSSSLIKSNYLQLSWN